MQSQCSLLLCPTTAYLYLSHLVTVTLKEKWQVLSKITGRCGKVTKSLKKKKKRSEFKQKSQKSCSQKSEKLFCLSNFLRWRTFTTVHQPMSHEHPSGAVFMTAGVICPPGSTEGVWVWQLSAEGLVMYLILEIPSH